MQLACHVLPLLHRSLTQVAARGHHFAPEESIAATKIAASFGVSESRKIAADSLIMFENACRNIRQSLQSDEEADAHLLGAAYINVSLTRMSLFAELRHALFHLTDHDDAVDSEANSTSSRAEMKSRLLSFIESSRLATLATTTTASAAINAPLVVISAARSLIMLICDVRTNPSFLVQGAENVRRDLTERVLAASCAAPTADSLLTHVEATGLCAVASYIICLLQTKNKFGHSCISPKSCCSEIHTELDDLDRLDNRFFAALATRVEEAKRAALSSIDTFMYASQLGTDFLSRLLGGSTRGGGASWWSLDEAALVEAVVLLEHLVRASLVLQSGEIDVMSANVSPSSGPVIEVKRECGLPTDVLGALRFPRLQTTPNAIVLGPAGREAEVAFRPNNIIGPLVTSNADFDPTCARLTGLAADGGSFAAFFSAAQPHLPFIDSAASPSSALTAVQVWSPPTERAELISSATWVRMESQSSSSLLCTTTNGELWRFDRLEFADRLIDRVGNVALLSRKGASRVLVDPSRLSTSAVVALGYGLAAVGPVLRIVNTLSDQPVTGENPFLRFQPPPTEASGGVATGMTVSSMAAFSETQLVAARYTSTLLFDVATGSVLSSMGPRQHLGGSTGGEPVAVSSVGCVPGCYESIVAIGMADGLVHLWDPRVSSFSSSRQGIVRDIRPIVSPAYLRSREVTMTSFGARGLHSLFVHVGTNTSSLSSSSPVQLYCIGYEKVPVWQSPDETSRPVIGADCGRTFLHCLNGDARIVSTDVTTLS